MGGGCERRKKSKIFYERKKRITPDLLAKKKKKKDKPAPQRPETLTNESREARKLSSIPPFLNKKHKTHPHIPKTTPNLSLTPLFPRQKKGKHIVIRESETGKKGSGKDTSPRSPSLEKPRNYRPFNSLSQNIRTRVRGNPRVNPRPPPTMSTFVPRAKNNPARQRKYPTRT